MPAKPTYLLQPLDSHCFQRLQRKLKEKFLSLLIESGNGTVSHEAWLSAVFVVIPAVLCGVKWKPAFQANGLLGEHLLSARVLQALGWQSSPAIPNSMLDEDQLRSIFPKGAKVNRNSLFSWCLKPKPKAGPKAAAKAKAKAAAAPMLH